MSPQSLLTHLECSQCGKKFAHSELQTFCAACNQPLVACYDLDQAGHLLTREMWRQRPAGMWRYRELLPLQREENIVTLGEVMTPLLSLRSIAGQAGLQNVWVKDEAPLPTGSFKARGMAMAVSRARELGVRSVAVPTAGNAGGALAAYSARAGLPCFVFMPKDVPRSNLLETQLAGADVTLVDGIISDCGKQLAAGKAQHGWFDMSTLKEPYRLEGKKTMGLELAEQLDWDLPDVILYPTGGGTGLIGMWKAFAELKQMNWLTGALPRMIAVQSSGCDPITRAFDNGAPDSQFFENANTVAAGLRVPKAFGDKLILKALQESGGLAISVSDDEIMAAVAELAEAEGLVVCPEGAATWAALKHLAERNQVDKQDRVVLFNTGSGLKYPEVMQQVAGIDRPHGSH